MPFVLITYQVPTMSFNPFNGWQSILREIYNVINNDLIKKNDFLHKPVVINILILTFGSLILKKINLISKRLRSQ